MVVATILITELLVLLGGVAIWQYRAIKRKEKEEQKHPAK